MEDRIDAGAGVKPVIAAGNDAKFLGGFGRRFSCHDLSKAIVSLLLTS